MLSTGDIERMHGSSPILRRRSNVVDRALTVLRLNTAEATRRNSMHFLKALPARDRGVARILVIGGGARGAGTDSLYSGDVDILTFDIYASTNTNFVADAHRIPLKDGSVDGVWIQAVLEHVVEPNIVASEIFRVLAIDGVVYSEVPFMQHVHEGAFDFTRYTLSGHRYLFKYFAVIDSGPHGGPGTQLNWAVDRFFRSVFRSRRAGKLAKILSIWLVWFDLAIPRSFAIDAASGTYFLGRKQLGKGLSHRDVVAFYSGAG